MTGRRNRLYADLIIEVLKTAQKPMTAYALLDALKIAGIKAPQTVYRALHQLLAEGSVHRLDSLNAYCLCQHGGHLRPSVFLICLSCGGVVEKESDLLQTAIRQLADKENFALSRSILELQGQCAACQKIAAE
jgi:Fur family zinc uptake transcriptional regulator